MSDLDVPDKYQDWPFEARAFVLAEANTTADLRLAIDNVTGLDSTTWDDQNAASFTKDELAVLAMALGAVPEENHD